MSSITIDTPVCCIFIPIPTPQMSTGLYSAFLWSRMESRVQQPCMAAATAGLVSAPRTATLQQRPHRLTRRAITHAHAHHRQNHAASPAPLFVQMVRFLLPYLSCISPLPTLDVCTCRPPHGTRAIIDPHLPNLSTSHRDHTHTPNGPNPKYIDRRIKSVVL